MTPTRRCDQNGKGLDDALRKVLGSKREDARIKKRMKIVHKLTLINSWRVANTSWGKWKMQSLKYLFILTLTLLSFGCYGGGGGVFTGFFSMTGPQNNPPCPNLPSVVRMVPKIEGQPDQLCGRRMSVQGIYAPKAEITMSAQGIFAPVHEIRPHYEGGDCWTTAGLSLDTLTEALSTALAHAGLIQVVASPEGSKYMLHFEVERQSLTFTSDDSGMRNCTATIDMSYIVSVNNRKDAIWKEKITGMYTVTEAPHIYGPRSMEAAAIEGAVAANLSVLINKLKDLPFDKE